MSSRGRVFVFFEPVPLQISEVHFFALRDSSYPGDDFDFIELINVGSEPLDLTNLAFTEGILFDFSQGAVASLASGQRVVVTANQTAFSTRYVTADMLIAGDYRGWLDNSGKHITLSGFHGQPVLDFFLDDSWYDLADGPGFSLVLRDEGDVGVDPSDPASWRPSHHTGGSPGAADPGDSPGSVVINEALTHTDDPPNDWIELHNTTDDDVDLSGWYLSGMCSRLRSIG